MTPYSEQVEREIGAIQHSITTGIAQLREMARMACIVAGVAILLAASVWGATS